MGVPHIPSAPSQRPNFNSSSLTGAAVQNALRPHSTASSSYSTLQRDGTIGHNGINLPLLRVLSAGAGLRCTGTALTNCHTLPDLA